MTDALTDHTPDTGDHTNPDSDAATGTGAGAPPDSPDTRGPSGPRITRRRLLTAGIGGAAALAGAGYGVDQLLSGGHGRRRVAPEPSGVAQSFHSRPDLRPTVTSLASWHGASGDYLFVGPGHSGSAQPGPMILDGAGDLVWFSPRSSKRWVTNVRVQSYRGTPVLTWWEGKLDSGYGTGEAVIADASYREIARLRAARGRTVDLHEFLLTDAGTALFTCTPARVAADLAPLGGPSDGHVLESIFQELDVASGRLVREWRSLDHVAPSESYRPPKATFDYLHANSIDVADDGNLLLSARHTWCIYKLDRRSGAVIWRMGGKRTQFEMGSGAQYAWQHDGRQVAGGRVSVFDDGYDGVTKTHHRSRGLILDVDERRRRTSLARAYVHPSRLLTSAMGNTQLLPNGNVVLGFGDKPYTTEFAADGTVVSDLRMPHGQHSYRGFRQSWRATPHEAPALVASRDRSSGRATLYASFNGATELAGWRVYGGGRASDLRRVGEARRDGFETPLHIGTGEGYAQVAALDARGREIARSTVIAV